MTPEQQWKKLTKNQRKLLAALFTNEGVRQQRIAEGWSQPGRWYHPGQRVRKLAELGLAEIKREPPPMLYEYIEITPWGVEVLESGTGRESNPTWLAVAGAGLAGAMAGAAGTFRGVGGNPSGEADYVELEEYEGAILMFPAEGAGIVGWTVDQCTGKLGYSHCALDIGLVNQEGEPLWVDSWALEGVGARPASMFEREPLRVPLTPSQASHARAVALHMLHEKTPYRGRYHGRTCSEFVVCCLPRSMLDEMHIPKNATPNDLAVSLGLIPKEENPRTLKKKLLR